MPGAVADPFAAAAVAFGVVFAAEFADKTQLLLLALAARGRPVRVLAGAAAAFVVLSALAVAVGGAVQRLVPAAWVALLAGLVFLALGGWGRLRAHGGQSGASDGAAEEGWDGEAEEREDDAAGGRGGVEGGTHGTGRQSDPGRTARRSAGFLAAFGLVALAEMGDKTQIVLAALAAGSGQPLATGVGGVLALVAASVLAVAAGAWLARHVDPERIEQVADWLFIALGVVVVLVALWRLAPIA